jgi:hypothetical protein
MSNTNINNENDTNVLRANDVIPPYNKNNHPEQKPLSTEQNSHNIKHKPKHTDTISTEHEKEVRQKAGIPKFDLARQIMSEQRKVVSIKRRSPDKKDKAGKYKHKDHSIELTVKPPPVLTYQEQLIAEIVRRDIQKLKER